MATIEQLIEMIGASVESDAVQTLVNVNKMEGSTHPNGAGKSPDVYWNCREEGYSLLHRDGKIKTAFVYVLPGAGFAPFQGSLPGELPSSATRTQVLQRFGIPSRTGEAMSLPFLGRKGAWDRFDGERVCIHFEYTEPDERVEMVTIMNAATAP